MRPVSLAGNLVGGSPIPGGRWVQVGCVLTDVFFIAFNAVLVFYFRFVLNGYKP